MNQLTRAGRAADIVQKNPAWFTAALIAIAVAIIAYIVQTDAQYDTLNFVPVTSDLVTDILTPILLIALLIERGLEVFVSTGRKIGRSDHEKSLKLATTLIAQLKERVSFFQSQLTMPSATELTPAERAAITSKIDDANQQMAEAQKDQRTVESQLDLYRSETARITFVAGAMIGLIVGLAGVRVVAPIVDFNLADWGSFQRIVFHSLDVVLTAGLLAGGANGIHQIISVFAEFTESSRRKAQS